MRVSLLVLLALMVCSIPVHAQSVGSEPLEVAVVPETPRPYQTITITPSSTLIDLNAATITVSVNGKVVVTGGVQRVPITLGGPGELSTIVVKATVGGKSYTKTIALRPADVALVVEPVSTTHPFYLGASLVAPLGRVRVIALPDLRTGGGTRLSPSALIYTWKWGDQVLAEQSGIGRYLLDVKAPVRYRDADIRVTVTNAEQTLIAEAATVIAPVDPVVRIYPTDPLSGPNFDHALLGNYFMTGEEQAFRGVPYFFSAAPSLAWAVNSQAASGEGEVTVRTTGTGAGTANLSLTAMLAATRQSITARLPVSFGAKQSANIFGF